MRIEGAVALVTGSNRGLGKAIVHALAAAGASRIYAAARDPRQVTASDHRIEPVALDVTDADQLTAAAGRARDVTLLVNNAGTLTSFDVLTATRSQMEADLRVNLFGTLGVIKAFLPVLERAREGATILNVLSLASLASVPSMGGYAASKAAAYSVTQALRPQLAPKRISLLAALAGPIDTDMVRDIALPKTSPDDVARALLRGVERAEEEIFPDPMAEQMGALWSRSPKELERAFASFSAPAPRDHFTLTLRLPHSPEDVFDAINDARSWWSGRIEGATDALGAEFSYRYAELHRSRQRVMELVRGERVVWHVTDADLGFVAKRDEWKGTDIVFDIRGTPDGSELRFAHVGLRSDCECHAACADGWTRLLDGNLRKRLATRAAQPDAFA